MSIRSIDSYELWALSHDQEKENLASDFTDSTDSV
jgi:hypothetical protein